LRYNSKLKGRCLLPGFKKLFLSSIFTVAAGWWIAIAIFPVTFVELTLNFTVTVKLKI
jgi:hypothetical protein